MFLSRVLLILLPVVAGAQDSYSHCSEVIRRIHKEGDARAVYFIGADVEFTSTFMKGHSDVPVMMTESGGAGERIDDVVIVVVQAESVNQARMEILEEIIKRLRVRKYAFISARTRERLHQMCTYFAVQKFTRIFGETQGVSYAFLTFADKLVPIVSKEEPLPDARRDLNGYSIRTTAQDDMPRVFRYPDRWGNLQIGGLYGLMFLSFVRMHNATFREVPLSKPKVVDIPGIWRAITDGRVELSINSYAHVEKGYFVSYPVYLLGWTVLTPIDGYLDPNQYFLRPFAASVWACIAATFLYIVLMDVLKSLAEGRAPNPWHCFSQSFLLMLNMSANGLVGNACRIHLLVVLYAFVLVNLYLNHLTSFLTVFIRIKQYDTLQELIDNKMHFLVADYIWKQAIDNGEFPVQIETIARPVQFETFISELSTMQNTSVGYAVGRDKGEFLIAMQSISGKPLFRLLSDYLGMVYTGFIMDPHSPFSEILTYFIMRSRETGLLEHWSRKTVWQAIKSGFRVAKGESDDSSPKPLSWNDLRFAWSSLAVGLTLALMAFAVELLWQRLARPHRDRVIES